VTLLTAGLGVLGLASGALAARVAELQVLLVPLSAASLAVGHYLAWRRGAGGRRQRLALWAVTPVAVALWIAPYLAR
jgi:hypothetical protein